MKKVSKAAQIRALYEKGMNNKQIAEALGFKQVYVGQIVGNYRRLLKVAGKSIETHGKPAYFTTNPSAYSATLFAPSTDSVLGRLRKLIRWIWTGASS